MERFPVKNESKGEYRIRFLVFEQPLEPRWGFRMIPGHARTKAVPAGQSLQFFAGEAHQSIHVITIILARDNREADSLFDTSGRIGNSVDMSAGRYSFGQEVQSSADRSTGVQKKWSGEVVEWWSGRFDHRGLWRAYLFAGIKFMIILNEPQVWSLL